MGNSFRHSEDVEYKVAEKRQLRAHGGPEQQTAPKLTPMKSSAISVTSVGGGSKTAAGTALNIGGKGRTSNIGAGFKRPPTNEQVASFQSMQSGSQQWFANRPYIPPQGVPAKALPHPTKQVENSKEKLILETKVRYANGGIGKRQAAGKIAENNMLGWTGPLNTNRVRFLN